MLSECQGFYFYDHPLLLVEVKTVRVLVSTLSEHTLCVHLWSLSSKPVGGKIIEPSDEILTGTD